nr:Chain P, upain-2-4 peptide [Phage display vector pTDisp]
GACSWRGLENHAAC